MQQPALASPCCPLCQGTARLKARPVRIRRGERILPLESWTWECPNQCPDPEDGATPFRFVDPALMDWEEAQAAHAWLERFSEPIPASQRPRRAESQRRSRIPLLLTEEETALLDRLRQDRPRGEYLRHLLLGAAAQQT